MTPLSPIPEIALVLLVCTIISLVFLIKRVKARKRGESVSLVGPIVATVIFANLLGAAIFLVWLGYGIMTSM